MPEEFPEEEYDQQKKRIIGVTVYSSRARDRMVEMGLDRRLVPPTAIEKAAMNFIREYAKKMLLPQEPSNPQEKMDMLYQLVVTTSSRLPGYAKDLCEQFHKAVQGKVIEYMLTPDINDLTLDHMDFSEDVPGMDEEGVLLTARKNLASFFQRTIPNGDWGPLTKTLRSEGVNNLFLLLQPAFQETSALAEALAGRMVGERQEETDAHIEAITARLHAALVADGETPQSATAKLEHFTEFFKAYTHETRYYEHRIRSEGDGPEPLGGRISRY